MNTFMTGQTHPAHEVTRDAREPRTRSIMPCPGGLVARRALPPAAVEVARALAALTCLDAWHTCPPRGHSDACGAHPYNSGTEHEAGERRMIHHPALASFVFCPGRVKGRGVRGKTTPRGGARNETLCHMVFLVSERSTGMMCRCRLSTRGASLRSGRPGDVSLESNRPLSLDHRTSREEEQ